MASVNKVILVGNLGADPEQRFLPNGDAVCNIKIATSDQWKDKGTGEKKEATEWHRVVFFLLHTKDDYNNCASGRPIEYLVTDPATGLGVVVTVQHCPGNSGSWLIGVANHDPDYSDRDFPRWPMRIEAQNYRNGFQPALVIEAPEGVKLTCLQRDASEGPG